MIDGGIIVIRRSIRNSWLWKDPVKLQWWIDLIMEANFKPSGFNVDRKFIACGKGQSVKSLRSWAVRWGISQTSVKRFLKLLERDRLISVEPLKRTTRITILNYDSYQKPMLQLKDSDSSGYISERYDPVTTNHENLLQLMDSMLGSYEDSCYNLNEKNVTNRKKKDSLFKQEFSSLNSSSERDLTQQSVKVEAPEEINIDSLFDEFLKTPEAEKLERETPHSPTH